MNCDSTEDLIETIVDLSCSEAASLQARHWRREILRNLVRLAKAEQSAEQPFSTQLHIPMLENEKFH